MAEGIYVLSEDERRKFAGIVSKVWADGEFAGRYETEPFAVLAEHGIDYPEGFPPPLVPERPAGDLSLENLEEVAAGSAEAGCLGSASSISTIGGCLGTASTFGCGVGVAPEDPGVQA